MGLKQDFNFRFSFEEIGKIKAPIKQIKKRTEEFSLQGFKGDKQNLRNIAINTIINVPKIFDILYGNIAI